MKLLYGTTNKSKIDFMQRRVQPLGIELLSLTDISAPKMRIKESGNSPIENARIKAQAYFDALKIPLFSCDSGLYIDGLDNARQPGTNVRGQGDYMTDDDAIAYYSALAAEMGGKMVARYVNAICLILEDGRVIEHMGDDVASEPFYLVSKPHKIRKEGFPLDSLSVNIETGEYYYDMKNGWKYGSKKSDDGFANFFKRYLM